MLSSLILWGGLIRAQTIYGLTSLELVGLLFTTATILYQVPLIFSTVYNTWLGQMLGYYTDLLKMGKWAVVTGATDGIGKAYCEEMARLGLNIVLISRSTDKLKKVAADIEKRFGVKTKIITIDFKGGFRVYKKIAEELEGLEVGTLINNIGMFYPYVEYLTELPDGDKCVEDLINCNILPMTMMTKAILPQMCERKKGVIVNISSVATLTPNPLASVYSAAKGYIERLSECLAVEYESKGIIIQCLIPWYVCTKMSRVRNPSWTSPSPTTYVRSALRTIGLQQTTSAYFTHRLATRATRWLAFWFPNLAPRFFMQRHGMLRTKKLEKLQAKKMNLKHSSSIS